MNLSPVFLKGRFLDIRTKQCHTTDGLILDDRLVFVLRGKTPGGRVYYYFFCHLVPISCFTSKFRKMPA